MSRLLKIPLLYIIGGLLYYGIEILWRGYSHPTMIILGGLCFILIGEINEYLSWDTPIWKQCLIATIFVTIAEFIAGCILNIWLGLNVWHYTRLSILGQISLPYMVLWYLLSGVAIVLDDYIRHWLFGEEKMHYKLV